MGKSSKIAKLRKDKYYNLAKLTGYRSRASFKLIQLHRRFGFLNGATIAVDLCAAPGGWLQVLSNMMPVASSIVGVDLFPIKPIKNVTTFVGDITTAECLNNIRNFLQGSKADIVIHDGAPNLGTSWEIDSFGQNHLTLHSIRLMTKIVKLGGWFVTKVFRSKDYMRLVEVLRKLFQHVHVTKPHASRKESAESFIVCQNFLGLKSISAEELEFKNVFKEDPVGEKAKVSTLKALTRKAKKGKSNRDGYENVDSQLIYNSIPLDVFLDKSNNVIALIQDANSINFDGSKYEDDTPPIIKEYAQDLKVLGYSELKEILDWRRMIQSKYGLTEVNAKKDYVPLTAEEKIEKDLKKVEEEEKALQKRHRKRERKTRRLQEIEMRAGAAAQNLSNVDTGEYASRKNIFEGAGRQILLEEYRLSAGESAEEESEVDSETASNLEDQVAIQMEFMRDRRKNTKTRRLKHLENTLEKNVKDDDEDSVEYDEGLVLNEDADMDMKFMMGMAESKKPKKDTPAIEISSSEEEEKQSDDVEETCQPETPLTAEEMALVAQMKRSKKKKEQIINDLWNKTCRGEEDLPSWFVEEEAKAYVPLLPITKEEVDYFKKLQREIDEKPRKAVIEARERRKRRVVKVLQQIRKKTEQTNLEDEEMNPDKIDTLKRLYKKAATQINVKKKKTYIVAKKHLVTGKRYKKPKAIKGPYKVVDARMKKDKKVDRKVGKHKRSKSRMKRRR